jgi:hypothetical protein
MGLRKFSLRAFLKKNFDFITGVTSEVGLTLVTMAITLFICFLLVAIKSLL